MQNNKKVPNRRELKWKNINWEVSDVDLISAENGSYVTAILKKMKNKKVIGTLIQVANIKRRERIEVADKELTNKIVKVTSEAKWGRLAFTSMEETSIYNKKFKN